MNVTILTEALPSQGVGHVTRCQSLYESFCAQGHLTHLIVNTEEDLSKLVEGDHVEMFDWVNQPEALIDRLTPSDVVVIDSYVASQDLYRKIAACVKLGVYIDDNKRINYPSGLVVNSTVGADYLFDFSDQEGVSYLLGSRFIPIRKSFQDLPAKRIHDRIESLMITFGGNDAQDMTLKTLKHLCSDMKSTVKNVVLGASYKREKELKEFIDEKTQLYSMPNVSEMKNIMEQSDVAISGSGQTLYELAAVGTPTIAVSVADNQKNNVKGWQQAGFVEFAGDHEDSMIMNNITRLIDKLQPPEIRGQKSEIGQVFVDGKGADRIVKEVQKRYSLSESNEVQEFSLREIESDDRCLLYHWVNDPLTRKNSLNSRLVSWADHKAWFKEKSENKKTCRIYIAQTPDTSPIGQVRFDRNLNQATVSYSVASQWRGYGIGARILDQGLERIKAQWPDLDSIYACVKQENIASCRTFRALDFEGKSKGKLYEFVLTLKIYENK